MREGPVRDKLAEMGFTPVGSTDTELRTRIDSGIDKWTRVVKAANIQPER